MNIAAYLRVSGKSQTDGDGFARQTEKIDEFCGHWGLVKTTTSVEDGVSGAVEAMERPSFSKLMSDIDAGRAFVGAIVVERMDRLARDLMVQEFLLRECRERDIQVFAADQGNLTDMASNDCDPTRILIRQILGALAQWEKAMLVAKLAAARNRIKESGQRCEGNRPYGFKPGESTILGLMLNLRSSGMNNIGIANMLNEGGFKNRRGGSWTYGQVYDIFRSHPVDIGSGA